MRASTSKTSELTAERACTSKTPELMAKRASTSKAPKLVVERASTSKAPELTAGQTSTPKTFVRTVPSITLIKILLKFLTKTRPGDTGEKKLSHYTVGGT